ncbi:hypothetical protein GCM10022226_59960 [Sphaerisporangium flaviroseum]|uniref:Uncharacterized protein n=1 Tax=Sphaerisporangium flaviroseum TaxID=509199 RepID=A0ABP7J110_9ACTN
MKEVIDLASTGALKDLEIGDPVAKAFHVLGPPDGETEVPDDKIYAFADIQIIKSRSDVVWYMAIEPDGDHVDFPPGLYKSVRLPTPHRNDLLAALRDRGEELLETQPYVWDQTWWQVVGSGVILHFDEDGLLDGAVKRDRALNF